MLRYEKMFYRKIPVDKVVFVNTNVMIVYNRCMHRIIDIFWIISMKTLLEYVSDRSQLSFPDFFLYTKHCQITMPVPRMQFCKNPYILNDRPLSSEYITTIDFSVFT